MAIALDIGSTVRLNNGVQMPRLGLGVYQAPPGKETQAAVLRALECGYRHFDTARAYGNEADVGEAVRSSGIPRSEIFVTTKLWNADHGYDATLRAFEKSNERLGLGYIDLYLIHWPVQGLRADSWRAMTRLLGEGACRAIGVSNYTVRHLEEVLETSDVVPTVNQVEFSPFLFQRELLAFCREHGIQLEAYSPLTQGRKLDHPAIVAASRKYGRTPAQILIRWALQHDIVVIPKSTNPARIQENAQVFDFSLDAGDMEALDALDEGFRTCWDPTGAP